MTSPEVKTVRVWHKEEVVERSMAEEAEKWFANFKSEM